MALGRRDVVTLDAGAIVGELDMSNTDRVRSCLDEIAARGASRLVFDLAGIEFIDSSGITVLLEGVNRVEAVTVRNPSPSARRIIETTGLSDVLRFES